MLSLRPRILAASSAFGALAGVFVAASFIAILALPASAQQAAARNPAPTYGGDFERPYGFAYGEETQAYDANTRDANGNRVIIDGRMMTGADQSSLSYSNSGASAWAQSSAGAGFGSFTGQAIGNQVNVITQGNYNTVVVTTTQTNTGNQTVLNGKINLP